MSDNYKVCPNCDGTKQETNITDWEEFGPLEVETKCSECGHEDFWAYGYYQFGKKEKS